MLRHKNNISKEIKNLRAQIKKLPPGHIISSRVENRYKWYQSDGHNKKYIPKNNIEIAEKLALKKYLSCKLENLKNEENAILAYISQHNCQKNKDPDELLKEDSRYYQLLSSYFKPKSKELEEWSKAPYDRSDYKKENLKHKSKTGKKLRSKSEVLIDEMLFEHKIPNRYECALELDGHIIYPDFTIRHPKTGEVYYWEHCGMMDDVNYVRRFSSKLEIYTLNGIIPSVNLIITYETKDFPLDYEIVEKLIEYYFS